MGCSKRVRALIPYSYLLVCAIQDGGSATSHSRWLRSVVATEIVVEIQSPAACGPVFVLFFFRIQHELKCESESVSVDSCAPQCPLAPPAADALRNLQGLAPISRLGPCICPAKNDTMMNFDAMIISLTIHNRRTI